MAKYMKKPVIREAEQFLADHVTGVKPLPAGVERELRGDPASMEGQRVRFFVVTAHGNKAYLNVGDYVVTEPTGEGYYPCLKQVFEAEHDLYVSHAFELGNERYEVKG